MAPKNTQSNRTKPGISEGRLPQSQPRILGAVSNAGTKTIFKSQGARGSKQSPQILDDGFGNGNKGIVHHGDGMTIPDMFKNPQPIMHSPLQIGKKTISTNLMHVQELEGRGDCNDGSAPSASSNSPSQVSDECSFDMTAASMDLTLTSLRVSALSSNSEDVLTVIEEGEHCTPQDPSLGRAIMPVQGSENRRCNKGVGPAHSSVREGLGTFGSAQLDVFNNRAENDTLGQTEVTENFFSLSDHSKDSEDPNAGSSTDSESFSSSILSTISMTGQSVMQCREGATEADLEKTKHAKTNEKRKNKKSVNRARAMSWDYTDTQQFQHKSDNVFKGPRDPVTDSVGDGAPPSLHLICQTMMVQHKQIQGDNKKARMASKQLQVAVSKITKTCLEIGERIAMIETRTSVLEAELGTVAQQSTMHES
ncbi:hypothetical protein NDU88_001971 [Pleurodeles waltl]|uniref:Uncharacterized protein n=1 Tax=Pleurodeles waltl TaxID=8319 RepID=A0AAV7UU90_PLEWA|nr:hypothetical protein NDU88_001971 [Pleurodeles waltl]